MKKAKMNFEHLANELMLDIFKYLSNIDLLRIFSNLNCRFNNLLRNHFRISILDFRSISKSTFNRICEEHLPLIIEDLNGLRLSDDDDTPDQINHFLSFFTLNQFVQLKSLSFYHLSSNEMIEEVVLQLSHLPNLTHLNLIDCDLIFYANSFPCLLNCIWDLSKLTHCHLDFHSLCTNQFSVPTIRSKSIQKLSIQNIELNSQQLIRLFECTPNLRDLSACVDKFSDESQFPLIIQSMNSLKLIVDDLTHQTIHLLTKMPNLTRLILHTGKNHMDGHKWKQLIIDHLPKLEIFRFMMFFPVNNEKEMNAIFESYRTPFWLIEHQWFIRCHWNLEDDKIWIYLYTLPYSFSFYTYVLENSNSLTKSTCPNENDYCSYDRVTTLIQHHSTLNHIIQSNIRFPNIRHLELKFPLSDEFLSIFPRLDQLMSLKVSSHSETDADIALSQLQTVINRSPRLYLLTIALWNSSMIQQLPLYLTSKSIRRLDLQSYHYQIRDRCFNNEECLTFLQSSLAKQCEVLQIVVDNQSSIGHLTNGLKNLRALKVVYQCSLCNNYVPSSEERIRSIASIFSRTLTENLSATTTIRLWIC